MRFLTDEECLALRRRTVPRRWLRRDLDRRGAPGSRRRRCACGASREERILITEDRDFGELVIRQCPDDRGIVLRELDRSSNVVEADLVRAIVVANADRLTGNLLVIEPGSVRFRFLPR
jgi:predicted nuclease of predicted toxin-antitoxin system